IPLGILYGDRNHYLIAKFPQGKKSIRHFILGRIKSIEVLDEAFDQDQGFNLEEHCAKSFGAFQEEPFEVEWRFSPLVAQEAMNFIFHPTQKMKFNQDGSLTVKFVAGGRLEMAWHLYSWGEQVKVVKPRDFWESLPKVY
ncbi:MAG: WYL domain-containing protein, partial [Deltaproteobacteria bacterium]|nr:WYL domain-containing protein [Deltaproteobacteria bacterium]